jgi:cytidine deaminase
MSDLDSILPRWLELRSISRLARERAWSPYSKFQVGAAVLSTSGEMFGGCNVENASYGLTICAERVAMCSAIAAGHKQIQAVVISLNGIPVPCGTCRQFLIEFNPQMLILLDDVSAFESIPEMARLSDLLPRPFRLAPN